VTSTFDTRPRAPAARARRPPTRSGAPSDVPAASGGSARSRGRSSGARCASARSLQR
jgi:hypothetical protein